MLLLIIAIVTVTCSLPQKQHKRPKILLLQLLQPHLCDQNNMQPAGNVVDVSQLTFLESGHEALRLLSACTAESMISLA